MKKNKRRMIAGILAGMMTLSFSGCSKYSGNEDGGYYLTENYSLNELKSVKVHVVNNDVGEYVIILKGPSLVENVGEEGYIRGLEILTDAEIDISPKEVVESFKLHDYLFTKEMIKDRYTSEDFEEIYSMLNKEYINNQGKKVITKKK